MLVGLALDTDVTVTPPLSPVNVYDDCADGSVVPVTVMSRLTAPSPAVFGLTSLTVGFGSAANVHAQSALVPPEFGREAVNVDVPVVDGPTLTSAVSVCESTYATLLAVNPGCAKAIVVPGVKPVPEIVAGSV